MRLDVLSSWVVGGVGELEVRSLRIPVYGEEYVGSDGVVRPIGDVEPVPLSVADVADGA
jgi:hypothetical protein